MGYFRDITNRLGLTTDRNDPNLGYGSDEFPVLQNTKYLVLSAEELAKGFVRPVRMVYIHTVCGSTTTMNQTIAETYAREPTFYGATYCVNCSKHRPVGEDGEFIWQDGTKVGT